jgi:hypothetical protein
VNDGVVDERVEIALLCCRRVVAVIENISDHRDFGSQPIALAAGNGSGAVGCIASPVHMLKNIALDPGIGAIDIQPIIGRAGKDVVDDVEDGRGPFAAAMIDHVGVTDRLAEEVMADDSVPVAADVPATDEFKFRGAGRKLAVADDV